MSSQGKTGTWSPAHLAELPESPDATPKVSVAMITYNHASFIAHAVESVMMQKADFDYEVIIGEDCSKDNTRRLLLELQAKHPGRLKLLLHERNLGGNENFKRTLDACRGKYLAILEGDDYWTSPHKLQKQVDALDRNPDWSICTHRMIVVLEDKSQPSYHYPAFCPKPVSTLDDLARAPFAAVSASLYRKSSVERYPEWIFRATLGDYALSLLYAQYGKIGFIDETMSAYRLHAGGSWSQQDKLTRKTVLTRDLRTFGRHMGRRPRRILKGQAARLELDIAKMHLAKGELSEAREVMASMFPWAYCLPGVSRHRLSRMGLMTYAPWIIPLLHKVKWFVRPPKSD